MHIKNTEWLEAAYENFESAIASRNYNLAQAVIEDTRDKGFTDEASQMEQELKDTPVEQFITKSQIQPHDL